MNTEDIREGGVYRAMLADWRVERITNGKVRIVRDEDRRIADLALDHFAKIAEGEVGPTPPTEVSPPAPTDGG